MMHEDQLNYRLPVELVARWRAWCLEHGISQRQALMAALDRFMALDRDKRS